MPVRAIAARALAMKGCPLSDRRTMKRTRALVSQTMAKWAERDLVVNGAGQQHAEDARDLTQINAACAP